MTCDRCGLIIGDVPTCPHCGAAQAYKGKTTSEGHPFLWCLLFGCFYFLKHGIWGHAIASFALAVLTSGISWFIYPFFARSIMEKHQS